MIADPFAELAILAGLCWLGWRWLHRSPRITPPSWFAVAEPQRSWRIVPAPPYDWATDPDA